MRHRDRAIRASGRGLETRRKQVATWWVPSSSLPSLTARVILLAALLAYPSWLRADDTPTAPGASGGSADPAVLTVPTVMTLKEEVVALRQQVEQLKRDQNDRKASISAEAAPDSKPGAAPPAPPATEPPVTEQAPTPPAPATSPAKPAAPEPFAFADFTWLNGNSRQKDAVLDTKVFTGEFRVDANYVHDFNHPKDHTLDGAAESGRTGEVQVQQLGIGGDFHFDHARGRLMTQFGMYSTLTPRNDSSPSRGQWDMTTAYRYVSEAYGGYHWDKLNGINLDAGIFMSYVGLFSYYSFDNWAYMPSYVSANTPWFFNGLRLQIFTSDKLKIEPWFINGWQSYGKFNEAPGLGLQLLWRPNGSVSLLSNSYWGKDTLGVPDRKRIHSDNSLTVKYYDHPDGVLGKAAFSFTGDFGCETGGGVSCTGGSPTSPTQNFIGFMLYNRLWFKKDVVAVTLGAGAITNRSTGQRRPRARPTSR